MNSKSLSDYYYNHSFMDGLRKKLPKLLPNTYCIAAIDIEHFRLFNKLYGRSSGDEVIRYICACLKQSSGRCKRPLQPLAKELCYDLVRWKMQVPLGEPGQPAVYPLPRRRMGRAGARRPQAV